MDYSLHLGDCLETLRGMPDNSVDSVVTDPPYGLSFMGKKWDYDVPSTEIWAECLRVLKPGGHLLAFAGTRTQHRMAVRIEDAGFEIRDMIAWVYGSGMPKSFNMSREKGKTICGCDHAETGFDGRATCGEGKGLGCENGSAPECDLRFMQSANVSPAEPVGQECGQVLQSSVQESRTYRAVQGCESCEGSAGVSKRSMERRCNDLQEEGQLREHSLCAVARVGATDGPEGRLHNDASTDHGGMVRLSADANGSSSPCGPRCAEQRPAEPGAMAGQSQPQAMGAWPVCGGCGLPRVVDGLGTALKPALEPITVARKPFKATVAANVLVFGTGALNIDACRVGSESTARTQRGTTKSWEGGSFSGEVSTGSDSGRWPANLIHDGSPEVIAAFPDAPGQLAAASTSDTQRDGQNCYGMMKRGRGNEASANSENAGAVGFKMKPGARRLDAGSAARFFYCAKTSRKDRNEGLADPGPQFAHGNTLRKVENTETAGNTHPTVKPTDLMAYLLRLVTPAGGTALDPFMGSGSTGKAAMREGFRFIGCELDEKYMAIAKARIEHECSLINAGTETQADRQAELFG